MDDQILTFGETLEKYMKANKVTIERLRRSMNLKSNTSVARILKDEHTYKKVEEFYNKFMTVNPFRLVEYEKKQFVNALEVSRLGKDKYLANMEMMYFVNKKPNPQPFTCAKLYGTAPRKPHSLADLFNTYAECKSVRICLVNCVFDDIVQSLINCSRDNKKIQIEQYIPYEENIVKEVRNFISILPILNHNNYNCYQAYFTYHNDLEILNRFNNIIFAFKTSESGKVSIDIISLKSNMEYTCVYNENGKPIFDFFSEIFDNMKTQHNRMKENLTGTNVIENLYNVASTMLSLEEAWDQILIKPNFCFSALEADVLKTLFSKSDMGNEKAAALYEMQQKRHALYCKKSKRHIGIYTVQGIQEFLNTGMLSDHVFSMRPFTAAEAKTILKNVIAICEAHPMNKIHLLKSNINYNNYQYTFFGQNLLYFSDRYTDYGMEYSYITSTNEIVEVFYEFVMNELIPRQCYPADESLEIMKEML